MSATNRALAEVKARLFDDTIEREPGMNGDRTRVTLLLEIPQPSLNE